MLSISYHARVNGDVREVTIVPEQQLLVVRAMQRLNSRGVTVFDLEQVKAEVTAYTTQFQEPSCWLSDTAMQKIIDVMSRR